MHKTHMSEKLLTIVIPCYNAEKYIARCVSSLEGLDGKNVSILFVNDGSVDSTKTLIETWIQKHDNAMLISKSNGGYSTAINTGLDNCHSEYVMFMGIDDEIIASGINKICANLQRHHPDILAFSTIKVYDDKEDGLQREKEHMTDYERQGFFETDINRICTLLPRESVILFARDTSRCFKMSVVGDYRYFGKTGVSADGCFSSLVAIVSKSFEFVNENCYLWHLHSDSVSSKKKTMAQLTDEINVWNSYFNIITQIAIKTEMPSHLANHIMSYKRACLRLNDRAKSYDLNVVRKLLLKHGKLSLKFRIAVLFPRTCLFVNEFHYALLRRFMQRLLHSLFIFFSFSAS